MKCSVWKKFTVIPSYALLVTWQFLELKVVTRWNVEIVNNTFVTAATRQLIHQILMVISGIWLFKSNTLAKSLLASDKILMELYFDLSRDGSCELFPREMVESWQERINNRQVVGQLQAELFPQRGLTCPNCRQFNAKVSKAFSLLLAKIFHGSVCLNEMRIVELLN